eukprot:508285_1
MKAVYTFWCTLICYLYGTSINAHSPESIIGLESSIYSDLQTQTTVNDNTHNATIISLNKHHKFFIQNIPPPQPPPPITTHKKKRHIDSSALSVITQLDALIDSRWSASLATITTMFPDQQREATMTGIQSIDRRYTVFAPTSTAWIFTHPILWILTGYFILISFQIFTSSGSSPNQQSQKYLIMFILLNFTCCSALNVSAGYAHTCALSKFHTVKCWGRGGYGEPGLGDTRNRGDEAGEMGEKLPTIDLGSNFDVVQLAVGAFHACALSQTSKVKCFGRNTYGALGLGDTNNRGDEVDEMGDKLLEVDLGTNFTATEITAGWNHNCALSQSNTVKCWGFNMYGQLGIGDTSHRGDGPGEMGDNLLEIDFGASFQPVTIMAGPYHNCALSTTNTMKCWGMNLYGQLGYGDTNNRG